MAPIVKEFQKYPSVECKVCVTAQHREMLDQVLNLFDIVPDYDLDLMKDAQNLNDTVSTILTKIDPILSDCQPELVLVHGDTATTLSAALGSYFQKIDVGHVEAGLRTGDIYSPWPEELNRKLTTSIAKHHFLPTVENRQNLLNEGVAAKSIHITGNTVIDALLAVRNLILEDTALEQSMYKFFENIDFNKRIILVTGHRRENFLTWLCQHL